MPKKLTPRILIGAPKSGSGKTLVVCALLEAMKQKGWKVAAFKCGPDYIDPMFHKEVLGVDSWNLDGFFCDDESLKRQLSFHSQEKDIAVIEGVMGYYDGVSGITTKASSYHVAKATKTPGILVVDCKGASLSILAEIKGFLEFQEENHLEGVILNRISPMFYPKLKEEIESRLSISVFGYLPVMEEVSFPSRHLGLYQPGDILEIKEKIKRLGKQAQETIEIERLKTLFCQPLPEIEKEKIEPPKVRVAFAKDEGFGFIYPDNLEAFRRFGIELIPFSPLSDEALPQNIQGLVIYGGYPELYAKELEKNQGMRREISLHLKEGMPCIAECGGFMYLTDFIQKETGERFQMVGHIQGGSYHTNGLKRFGYGRLGKGKVFGQEVEGIPFHEFHYYDSEYIGEDFWAEKPNGRGGYACMVSTSRLFAGYPHFYYPACMEIPKYFAQACLCYQEERGRKEKK